jgi:hypothetical protein
MMRGFPVRTMPRCSTRRVTATMRSTDERQDERQRYPERLVTLLPEGMKSELAKVARERSMTKSERARQLILNAFLIPAL